MALRYYHFSGYLSTQTMRTQWVYAQTIDCHLAVICELSTLCLVCLRNSSSLLTRMACKNWW